MAAISWVCVDGGRAMEEKRENSCEGCPQSSGNRKLLETRLPAGKRRRLVCVIDGPCHVPVDFELICFSFLFLLLFLFWISIFMQNFTQFDLGPRHARTCPGLSFFSIWHLTFDVASSSRHTLSCAHTHTNTHMPSGSTEQVNDANDFGFRMGPHRFTRQDVRPFALCALSL